MTEVVGSIGNPISVVVTGTAQSYHSFIQEICVRAGLGKRQAEKLWTVIKDPADVNKIPPSSYLRLSVTKDAALSPNFQTIMKSLRNRNHVIEGWETSTPEEVMEVKTVNESLMAACDVYMIRGERSPDVILGKEYGEGELNGFRYFTIKGSDQDFLEGDLIRVKERHGDLDLRLRYLQQVRVGSAKSVFVFEPPLGLWAGEDADLDIGEELAG